MRRAWLFAATLVLAPIDAAWAVPPPTLDGPPITIAPVAPIEGPRRPHEPEPPSTPISPPAPTIDPEQPSGIEFAVPPPTPAGPGDPADPSSDSTARAPTASIAELRDPGRAPASGNWLLVSGGFGLAMAGMGGSYFISTLYQDTSPGVDIGPEVTSISIAATGVAVYGLIALSVGGLRNYQLQRWARRHRVVPLPQGDGLLMGGSLALFSSVGLIPLSLGLIPRSPPLGVAMLVTTVAASAIGGPIMLALGSRRLRRYRETNGWRRRAPRVVQRPSIQPTQPLGPAQRGVTFGVAGQF